MMRESKKSLKTYFFALGILGIISGLGIVAATNTEEIVISAITLILGGLYLYYGIKLYDFLQKSPKTLINFVIITSIIKALSYILDGQWFILILIALVAWYLIHNIKKLSHSQATTQPQR